MAENTFHVVASEAKQSIGLRRERMDGVVASLLAMTKTALEATPWPMKPQPSPVMSPT